MRKNRFLRNFDLSHDTIVSYDRDLVSQIRSVLKVAYGEIVTLTDGNGKEVDVAVKTYSSGEVVFQRQGEIRTVDQGRRCTLYCAIIKNDRFEYVVQKVTEIGVSEIIPVITHHTVKQRVRPDRLRVIAREAVEQSGQAWMPLISEPITLTRALHHAHSLGGSMIFCDQGGKDIFSIADSLEGRHLSLFIGPEGGWDDEERRAAREIGARSVGLGENILRADTAAIAAAFVAKNYLP